MCASIKDGENEQIVPLRLPEGSVAGDVVTIGNFKRTPINEINPKKSQWDQVKGKVNTNKDGKAVYDGEHEWKTSKGNVTATLKNAVIS